MDEKNFEEFEGKLGISFKDKALLKKAFTHRSYLNENRSEGLEHNERLEFLGDAVLELVTTRFLFERYPDKAEGDLTAFRSALVNTITLSKAATDIEMNDYLLLSKGESKDTGRARQYILADAFEALIGAIYLDQEYDAAKAFIERTLFPFLDEVIEKRLWQDAKSFFQEQAQEKMNVTPRYETLREIGPDHDKRFVVGAFLGEELVSEGEGKSKQEAEQMAAERGLQTKEW